MVKVNEVFVFLYGIGVILYLCFLLIGVGENIGVYFVLEYLFVVFCMLVGVYFKGGLKLMNFIVFDYDCVVFKGIGVVKVGGNYVVSLFLGIEVKELDYLDCVYFDLVIYMKIEEVGVVNFFGIMKDGKFIIL